MKHLLSLVLCLCLGNAFAQALTPAQLVTLKADIQADNTLASQPLTSAGAAVIVQAYKATSTTDVWRTDCRVTDIYDAITWTNFTPNDAADSTTLYLNRIMLVQVKQMNLQNMLQGRQTIDASKANIRGGLRDAVIALPTGTGGAAVTAGGVSGATVLAACTRKANRGEALYATVNATTGSTTARLLVFEGSISTDDVQAARELP